MVSTDFDAERSYDDQKFSAQTVFESERTKVILGYFEPGQFIPVHAPESDLTITVHSGSGIVRTAEGDHDLDPGSVVVVPAGEKRGIRADDESRLEATLVTAPPPTDAEHELVRKGLHRDEFEPSEE